MEIEVKYDGGEKMAKALLALPALAPFLIKTQKIEMQAIYYDTPGGQLSDMGLALRFRKEGAVGVCALKGGKMENGLAHRLEIERPAETAPSGFARLAAADETPQEAAELLKTGVFEERAKMEFLRDLALYSREGLVVEIAHDLGCIRAAGRQEAIDEIELELKEGSEEAFLALIAGLEQALPLKRFQKSKYARAKALMALGECHG